MLYDVRAWATGRCNPSNGHYIATVQAVQPGMMFQPDAEAVRQALPANWRRAFDRATWWMMCNSSTPGKAGHMTLRSLKGKELALLECYEVTPK